jgi:translation initiation factor 1 (eIF-1/SUI1)
MKLTITTETTGRRGKQVTVIRGITHNLQVIETLTKK